jgi:thiamine kinase-like enzyme
VREIVSAVNEVISGVYPETKVAKFHFSRLYRVGMGENACESIPLVFGDSLLWRLKLNFKNLRKKASFKEVELKLPSDGLFFSREDKEGLIIVCPRQNFILKIFRDPPHMVLLEREIKTLKLIAGSPFEKDSSKYLSDGLTSNGARWVMTDFRSNTHSLKNFHNFEKNWFEISYSEIMPRMAEFYKLNSPVTYSVDVWLNKNKDRILAHPEAAKLQNVLAKIEKQKDESLLLDSVNHYDLHTGNVLYAGGDKYSIIDWEGNYRSPVVIDAFDFLRRYLQKNRSELSHFETLSDEVFKNYQSWLEKHFHLSVSMKAKKVHFLIYAVERTLFFWEIAKINRLEDKRAIEKFIIEKY